LYDEGTSFSQPSAGKQFDSLDFVIISGDQHNLPWNSSNFQVIIWLIKNPHDWLGFDSPSYVFESEKVFICSWVCYASTCLSISLRTRLRNFIRFSIHHVSSQSRL